MNHLASLKERPHMAFRTVYGNTISENGWRMVDADGCTNALIPGTTLRLPFRTGDAQTILTAWASWFNANVESLDNPGRGHTDEGSFTWTNSVASSNHLSGTAMDLNWSDHPFHVSYGGFTAAEIATVRRGLALFKGCIWWGQDWSSPKDPMHFQLNYPEGDGRIAKLANELRNGYLGIYTPGGPERSTPVPAPGAGERLEYGSHGDAVKRLQDGMNRVFPSYPGLPLVVDGDFGPRTELAVKEFQRRVGMEVSGVVGPITRKHLAKYGIKP